MVASGTRHLQLRLHLDGERGLFINRDAADAAQVDRRSIAVGKDELHVAAIGAPRLAAYHSLSFISRRPPRGIGRAGLVIGFPHLHVEGIRARSAARIAARARKDKTVIACVIACKRGVQLVVQRIRAVVFVITAAYGIGHVHREGIGRIDAHHLSAFSAIGVLAIINKRLAVS